jgi:alginate O-acetyltransferase complex protein AlgI
MIFASNNIFEAQSLYGAFSLYYLQSYAVLLIACIIGATQLPKHLFTGSRTAGFLRWTQPALIALCLLVSTAFLVDETFNPFWYFRF